MKKIKLTSLLLAVFFISTSLILTGCSAKTNGSKQINSNQDIIVDDAVGADASLGLDSEEDIVDPDIGELDDIEVSDELPQ